MVTQENGLGLQIFEQGAAAFEAAFDGESTPTRATRVEAELQQRTVRLLENRARIQIDHNFLQHFAQSAQNSAAEQRYTADATTQALNNYVAAHRTAQEQLAQMRLDLTSTQTKWRANREAETRAASAIQHLQRYAANEIGRLRGAEASDQQRHFQALESVPVLGKCVDAARRAFEDATREAQKQKRKAEEAEAALALVRVTTSEREILVQTVLHDTLKRLEADFARERAEHDALEHRTMRRAPVSKGVNSNQDELLQREDINHDSAAPLPTAAEEAYKAAVSGVAAATAASTTANTGLSADMQKSFGLASAIAQADSYLLLAQSGHAELRSEAAARAPAEEAVPSALEVQVAELRRRQEGLEAVWADRSRKHQSALVGNHIAALASRAARTVPAADVVDVDVAVAATKLGTEGALPRIGGLPRPLVANGLLYV